MAYYIAMLQPEVKTPEHVKLGKAKALEVVVLPDGSRMLKKSKVRYWVETQGAREDYFIVFREKIHRLTALEFKRRFKIIIKSGIIQHPLVEQAVQA